MKATYEDAISTVRTLNSNRHQAFLAGGCVRDLLLNVIPNDYDVTTSATPEEVQLLFPKTIPVGIAFGVIKVICGDNRELDVATFRTDGAYSDNRRPDSVEYSKSPEEDVKRRDFTINAMLMAADGTIIDFVGGQEDLRNRVLRAVGDPESRFKEDALRMMRAIRFAIKLNMTIDPKTWYGIKSSSARICTISRERVTEELIKTMSFGNCDKAYLLLNKSGLWNNYFVLQTTNDKWSVLLGLSEVRAGESFILPLFIMLSSSYTSQKDSFMLKLSLTNQQCTELSLLRNTYSSFCCFMSSTTARQRIMMHWNHVDLLKRVLECLSHNTLYQYGFPVTHLIESMKVVEDRQKEILDMGWPDPLINGDYLKGMGYLPCPAFTKMLDEVREQQLEGNLLSQQDVPAYLLTNYPAVPRQLEDGTIVDRMCRVHLGAACPRCGRPMGLTVERDVKGNPRWDTMGDFNNVRKRFTEFLSCTACGGRKKKKGFTEINI